MTDSFVASASVPARLSKGQREVLALLAKRDHNRDGCPSTQEISRMTGHRYGDWAYGKLSALQNKGLVQKMGTNFSGGRCWAATDAGRAAFLGTLADATPKSPEITP